MSAIARVSEEPKTDGTSSAKMRLVSDTPDWASKVQRAWAERTVRERVKVLRAWRTCVVRRSEAFCTAIASTTRTPADVRVSELLPLLSACKFLEQNAERILKTRRLGWRGRPVWLTGVESSVERAPLGHVLVIGPSNYPLLLPGVQVLQALVAGNSVTWKPGAGGSKVAKLFAAELNDARMPRELLHVSDESPEAGKAAVAAGADKVFFTGSVCAGRAVMRQLAETGTPSVMELSGCSAVVVLPQADLQRVAAAVAFGVRLNGSATCMAPRRLIVLGTTTARREALVWRLREEFSRVAGVVLDAETHGLLREMVAEAIAAGALLIGEVAGRAGLPQAPMLLVHATPRMRIAQTDLMAPVLSVIDVKEEAGIAEVERACPFALTASIFGEESRARRLAAEMVVGTVVVNDVIVPTADPRLSFGGRRRSGFGVTRGAEGLLEMTAVRNLVVRHGDSRRHYEPTGEGHLRLFDGLIAATHGGSLRERWRGMKDLVAAARTMEPENTGHNETEEGQRRDGADER